MYEDIKKLLAEAWEYIKKIWLKVVNFLKNIKGWFTEKNRLKKIQEDENKVASVVKEKLENGDYVVINCLFDKETNTLDDAEIMQTEDLDEDTKNKFGNKDMIILT